MTKTQEEIKRDSARWDALINSERIRILGTSMRKPEYQHFGMEIWSVYPNYDGKLEHDYGVKILEEYADSIIKSKESETMDTSLKDYCLTFFEAIECVLKGECWVQGNDFPSGVVLSLKDDVVITNIFNDCWYTNITKGMVKQMYRKVFTQPDAKK